MIEKELLECYSDVNSFKLFNSLNGMKEKGYFKGIDDNYPKYVITMDKIDYSQNGIIHLNLEDFLLKK